MRPDPVKVTVTFLEMEVPPSHYAPLPHNRQIALLRAKKIPIHFYRYLMDRVGRKWHWVNALKTSEEELEETLWKPDRDIRVLYLDGAPAGLFDIKPDLPSYAEIAYFGMMEHAMGTGLGRWFLGAAIEAAWAQKPQSVIVQTCTMDHPAALPLYQKMGFNPVGQVTEMVDLMTFEERSAAVMR